MSPYRVGKLCEVPAGQTPEQYRSAIISGKVKPKFKPYTHIAFHCGSEGLTLPITSIRTYRGYSYFSIGLGE